MTKRARPSPDQQLVEISENAKGWAKVLPHLSGQHRKRMEHKIAAAWLALQRREWPKAVMQRAILTAVATAANGCDEWIEKSGESAEIVEARAKKNAIMWIKMALNDDDAPRMYATKKVDPELVGKCVHAWRPSLRRKRGERGGGPAWYALGSQLLGSIGIDVTPAAVRMHEQHHLKRAR